MNPITHTKFVLAAAGLALGALAAAPARAQQTQPTQPVTTGLLGSNYIGAQFGYEKIGQDFGPSAGRDYGAYLNKNLMPGVDLSASFDDFRADALGAEARQDQLLAGFTGYAPITPYLKPFFSAQGGVDWLQAVNSNLSEHHNSEFDYILGAGAEWMAMPNLAITPFASYQAVHQYGQDWNYAVKATYRVTRSWSVSFTPAIDQHHNVEYTTGVNFHF